MRFFSLVFAVAVTAGAGLAQAATPSILALSSNEKSGRPLYSLKASRAPLGQIAKEFSTLSGRTVEVEKAREATLITAVIADASAERFLEEIARHAGLYVAPGRSSTRLQLLEPTASIDVKNEDVHAILDALKSQCAVRNLVIDPDVKGKGTFLFRDLPCSEAFKVVFASLGLKGDFGPNAGSVGIRR